MNSGASEEGAEIRAAVAGLTMSKLLALQVRTRPEEASIQWREGGEWHEWSWRHYGEQVATVAGALEQMGVRRGDRAVLLMHPHPRFHVADSAVMLLGGCPISIYNSSPPARIRHLVDHSRAGVIIVEDDALLTTVLAVRDLLPALRHVIVLTTARPNLPRGVLLWDDLLEADPVDLGTYAAAGHPDDLCTIVYTSGTTGPPKGVMLQHAAATWMCESYLRRLERDLTAARWISYLPVAHIATRFYAQYLHVYAGLEDVTCPNPADVESVIVDRPPHLFFAPPRLWERYLGSLRAWVDSLTDVGRRDRFVRAMQVGEQVAMLELRGTAVPPGLARECDEHQPARDELRHRLGLGELVTAATGAAPTRLPLIAAWRGLGVPMFEGYGLSESTGMLTVDPFRYRFGRVGRAMPGVELRVAGDGELLFRGGNAFKGYLDDGERTAEVVEPEGWVHTGDLATIDDGYVVLMGRKKELIITSGGENVSPEVVESALLDMPLIGQVCVVGDSQPSLGALILLDAVAVSVWATKRGTTPSGPDTWPDDPALRAEIGREVELANEHLARHEKVRSFRILPGEWLVDSDELTPTAKLRRSEIAAKYARQIDGMFA